MMLFLDSSFQLSVAKCLIFFPAGIFFSAHSAVTLFNLSFQFFFFFLQNMLCFFWDVWHTDKLNLRSFLWNELKGRETTGDDELSLFAAFLRTVVAPPPGGCICWDLQTNGVLVRGALQRKPQQTDGRYWELLITDTITFKDVSLSVRNESYTTSCQTPRRHSLGGYAAKKQPIISRLKLRPSRNRTKVSLLKAHACFFSTFFFFKNKSGLNIGSHFQLIKKKKKSLSEKWKKPAKLPVSQRWRSVAHPKLSHLLSQWVSWAQGVWDAAVCWGRGRVCE